MLTKREEFKERGSDGKSPSDTSVNEHDSESLVNEGSLENYLAEQLANEEGNEIQYRTCGLFKTSALLFSEYSCLAILSFPWAFSVLGLIPGIILTIAIALICLGTGLVLSEFCLRHPKVLDICDIAQIIFYGKRWAWYFTAVCFILNNVFIMGLHLLTWSKYINTVAGYPFCTIISTVIALVVCFLCSLPRTLANLTWLAIFSAVTMFISAILCIIFSGIQEHPGHYDGTPVTWRLWPAEDCTFVEGMSAMLNIMFTFVGQICYASFQAEMKKPQQFKTALKLVVALQVIVFTLCGSLIYVYVGDYYVVAPAFGSLSPTYKYIAFSFALPTTVFVGVLYSSISSRLIFFRLFRDSHHLTENTVVGWAAWSGIVFALWALAFIICLAIPFFSDLLSLMSSLFDSYFGGVLLGMCYIYMKSTEGGAGWYKRLSPWKGFLVFLNVLVILMGFFLLGPGTYSTVQSIINSFHAGTVGSAFSCDDNGM